MARGLWFRRRLVERDHEGRPPERGKALVTEKSATVAFDHERHTRPEQEVAHVTVGARRANEPGIVEAKRSDVRIEPRAPSQRIIVRRAAQLVAAPHHLPLP